MSSPLFNVLGNNSLGNMGNVIQQFQRFRNSFHGDARQQIQNMLNSGQITQEQYNRAAQMATELQRLIKG